MVLGRLGIAKKRLKIAPGNIFSRRLRRWNSTQPGHVLYPVSSCFQQALANTSLDGKYSSILRFEVFFKEIEGGSSSQRTEDQPEMDSCVSFVTTLQTSLSFPA